MAIQWKQSDVKDRLLAAVIASSAGLDIKEVACLFGQGATYDAVEGQLRKVKKLATELKQEAVGRAGPAKAISRSKKTKAVDSPVKAPVKGARVSKPKKAATLMVKREPSKEDTMLYDAAVHATSDEVEEEI